MSLKKWQERAEAEAEVERQEDEICRKYKTHKIANEFGQVEAEKLFKPITTRMDKSLEPTPAAEEPGPDYGMDEFDRINPDFRPEAPTTPPSPIEEEEEEEEFPLPPPEEEIPLPQPPEEEAAGPPPPPPRPTWE